MSPLPRFAAHASDRAAPVPDCPPPPPAAAPHRKVEAIKVVLEHMHDIDRAHDYANKVDEPAVWSELGHAQLEANLVPDAIASYLRSADTSMYLQVRAQAALGVLCAHVRLQGCGC